MMNSSSSDEESSSESSDESIPRETRAAPHHKKDYRNMSGSKNKPFYDSGDIILSTFAFLVSTNGMMLIYFRFSDKSDPRFSLAITWVMYLKILFMFNLLIKFLKASSDASNITEYYGWLKKPVKDEIDDSFLLYSSRSRYFKEFKSSDDSLNNDDRD